MDLSAGAGLPRRRTGLRRHLHHCRPRAAPQCKRPAAMHHCPWPSNPARCALARRGRGGAGFPGKPGSADAATAPGAAAVAGPHAGGGRHVSLPDRPGVVPPADDRRAPERRRHGRCRRRHHGPSPGHRGTTAGDAAGDGCHVPPRQPHARPPRPPEIAAERRDPAVPAHALGRATGRTDALTPDPLARAGQRMLARVRRLRVVSPSRRRSRRRQDHPAVTRRRYQDWFSPISQNPISRRVACAKVPARLPMRASVARSAASSSICRPTECASSWNSSPA